MWTPRLARIRLAAWSLAFAVAFGACNLHNEGVTAPAAGLSYPQALALSREEDADAGAGDGPDFLYVANTNYDLRFNGGSVQAYDLKAVERALSNNRCRTLERRESTDVSVAVPDETLYANPSRSDAGVPDAGDGSVALPPVGGMDAQVALANWPSSSDNDTPRGVLCDGRDPVGDGRTALGEAAPGVAANPDCCWGRADELDPIRSAHIPIDSYASGIAVSPDNKRLYVPVESFSRLLYFDLTTPGVPDCGAGPNERCRRGPGLKSEDDVPDRNFPGQISRLQVGTYSQLGLTPAAGEDPTFIATSHELGGFGLFVDTGARGPLLEDAVSGLPVRPTSLTFDPRHKLFYVTTNQLSYFSRLGVRSTPTDSYDGRERGPRELLFETSPVFVTGVSQAADLRDIVPDPFDDRRLWVLIRGSQESVAVLQLDATNGNANARLIDEVRLGAGPSQLTLINQDGRWFVLASSYDAKLIFVIDAQSQRLAAVVRNLSGPFEMVHDPVRRLVYVTDFRVSVVRVIDVAGLTQRAQPGPRIVATLGDPEFESGVTH
jgi:DNA-binding beta-propeller fold protein YncE